MVSRDDVVNAYRYILGREPEGAEAIETHMAAQDLAQLRGNFLNSSEFLQGLGAREFNLEGALPPQALPANPIDCEASAQQLESLLDRIRREWESFGKSEPHWSVLTHEKYKQDVIGDSREEFFASGKLAADIVAAFCKRHGLSFDRTATCFELGCGVGRITMHLARLFPRVIAADISRFHLDICREELRERAIDNVEPFCLDAPARLAQMPPIQAFCSFIVLQHNPPPVITFLLDGILGKLSRGGVAVFQVPTWRKGYRFSLARYLAFPMRLHMEMHVLPQEQVFRIIARNGCRVVEVREDGWADGRTAETISNTFFVMKD
jgi:SAM-dependent methyltransferase